MSDTTKLSIAFAGFNDDEVDRFLAGKSSPDEVERFRVYLESAPGASGWFDVFQSVEHTFAADLVTGAADALLFDRLGAHDTIRLRSSSKDSAYPKHGVAAHSRETVRRIDNMANGNDSPSALSTSPGFVRHFSRSAWYTIIGVGLSLAILVAGWHVGSDRQSNTKTAYASNYTTGNGQRATITLPDGSLVVLNVASQLTIPVDYAEGNRTLRLTGEALFTVAHNKHAPFVVLAGPSVTQVLGTSFSVRHYPTDTAAIVAVQDGKISVGGDSSMTPAIVTANQQVLVSWGGMSAINSATLANFAFATGRVMLDGISLRDAIPELNRWYDADIRLADPTLALRRITAEGASGSVSDLAAILAVTFDDIGVVRDGRTLTLYRR